MLQLLIFIHLVYLSMLMYPFPSAEADGKGYIRKNTNNEGN